MSTPIFYGEMKVGELTEITVAIAEIKGTLKTNTEMTHELLKIVKGDNGEGLMTKVALNKQSLKRAWWFIGLIAGGIVGVAAFVIRMGLQ